MSGSAAVVDEWRRRVDAEARSAQIAGALAVHLEALGRGGLAARARAVAAEERAHAAISAEVLAAAGGAPAPAPAIGADLDGALVELCVGETLAVPLVAMLRRRARVPVARAALTRFLRDEVGHRALGWDLLDALPERRAAVAARAFARLELTLAHLRAAASAPAPPPEDLAWGLGPARDYLAVVEATAPAIAARLGQRLPSVFLYFSTLRSCSRRDRAKTCSRLPFSFTTK